MPSATEVTVPHGETATATVTAVDTEGETVAVTVDPAYAGTVWDESPSVTVSATGDATVTVVCSGWSALISIRLRLFL